MLLRRRRREIVARLHCREPALLRGEDITHMPPIIPKRGWAQRTPNNLSLFRPSPPVSEPSASRATGHQCQENDSRGKPNGAMALTFDWYGRKVWRLGTKCGMNEGACNYARPNGDGMDPTLAKRGKGGFATDTLGGL
jgi:hypothetical protein